MITDNAQFINAGQFTPVYTQSFFRRHYPTLITRRRSESNVQVIGVAQFSVETKCEQQLLQTKTLSDETETTVSAWSDIRGTRDGIRCDQSSDPLKAWTESFPLMSDEIFDRTCTTCMAPSVRKGTGFPVKTEFQTGQKSLIKHKHGA